MCGQVPWSWIADACAATSLSHSLDQGSDVLLPLGIRLSHPALQIPERPHSKHMNAIGCWFYSFGCQALSSGCQRVLPKSLEKPMLRAERKDLFLLAGHDILQSSILVIQGLLAASEKQGFKNANPKHCPACP